MSAGARSQVFVERPTYRRRRMMDAARLLPILGAVLLSVPLLWPRGADPDAAEPVAMSFAMIYVFGIWAFLILLSALFSLSLRRGGLSDTLADPDTG